MTDNEIADLAGQHGYCRGDLIDYMAFAREVERRTAERCAGLCSTVYGPWDMGKSPAVNTRSITQSCAAAIRAGSGS